MLTARAVRSFHRLIHFGCALRLVPYKWDSINGQLAPASKTDLRWYRLHKVYIWSMTIFSYIRIVQRFRDPEGSQSEHRMENLLNLGWSAAYTFSLVNVLNFDFLRVELMTVANSILRQVQPKKDQSFSKEQRSWSQQVIIGAWLYAINPISHAACVIAAPCTPLFLSSLYFNCSNPIERKPTTIVLDHIPFFIQVYYDATYLLYVWAFNDSIIFIGLAWVIAELRKAGEDRTNSGLLAYRNAALLMKEINSSISFYLSTFPTLLFTITAVVSFGAIRLWHQDWRANMMFPMCGARCGFEGFTILNIAGKANATSKGVLQDWRTWQGSKYDEVFKRSCRAVECGAGSLYTFENSIVPVSIDNLSQLMFNLLIMFE